MHPAPEQIATDLHAAIEVYDDFPTTVPVRAMNWGLIAKAHASHSTHVDRAGTCTWVAIEDGLKKWDIAIPPTDDEYANPEAYGFEMFHSHNYSRRWNWHSLLLYPGTML